jgi:hypothetical protein
MFSWGVFWCPGHCFGVLGNLELSWATLGCHGEVSPVLGRLAEVFVYPCWSNDTYELFCVDPNLIFYPECLVCVGLRSLNKEPTFAAEPTCCCSISLPAGLSLVLLRLAEIFFSVGGYSRLRRLKIDKSVG